MNRTTFLSAALVCAAEMAGAVVNTTAVENPNPRTICNPIDLEYMIKYGKVRADGRLEDIYVESADPALVVYKGEYWLFASHGEGYWVSTDLAKWKFVQVDVSKPPLSEFKRYAPATCVVGDTLYLCHSEGGRMLKTTNPRDPASWEDVGKPDGWSDPGMVYDDPADGGDGFVYLYRGLSHRNPIEVLKLDPRDRMKKVAGPYDVAWPDKINRGFEVAGDRGDQYEKKDTQEGPWPIRHNGRYYLMCAVPGTQFATYSDSCLVADNPLGPFTFCANSPVTWKATGFTQGAGHGCAFRDLRGRWWKVDTCRVRGFDRRLVLLPAMIDEKGDFYTNTVFSDYPFFAPMTTDKPFEMPSPGWNLLSYGKPATASSNPKSAAAAFNENIQEGWMADTANPGEWLQVDLGKVYAVWSVQVNFDNRNIQKRGGRDNDFAYRYLLEGSLDGTTWYPLVDRTRQTVNRQHEYIEFARKVDVRYARLTNKGPVPGDGRLIVNGLRIFGEGGGAAPAPVDMSRVQADRKARNNRTLSLRWEAVPDAQGYIIRYGLAPDKLHTHFQVWSKNEFTLNSLNRGVDYWLTIDAYNESGVTRGTATISVPATEDILESVDEAGDNLAYLNRAARAPVYEAEKAILEGAGVTARYEAHASAARAVHGFGAAGTALVFANVKRPSFDGQGILRICYATPFPAKITVWVNGTAHTVELPRSKGWATFTTVDLPFDDLLSLNEVRLDGAGPGVLIDWIQIAQKSL